MQTQYFFERQSISQLFIFSAGVDKIIKSFNRNQILRVVQLESMPAYKYPNIDSGATPIGSAGHAPDRNSILRERIRQEEEKEEEEEEEQEEIGAYDRLQVPDHSLRGYSHRECWSRTR
jgi:hypothetical protein